jgi:hypothetical protein
MKLISQAAFGIAQDELHSLSEEQNLALLGLFVALAGRSASRRGRRSLTLREIVERAKMPWRWDDAPDALSSRMESLEQIAAQEKGANTLLETFLRTWAPVPKTLQVKALFYAITLGSICDSGSREELTDPLLEWLDLDKETLCAVVETSDAVCKEEQQLAMCEQTLHEERNDPERFYREINKLVHEGIPALEKEARWALVEPLWDLVIAHTEPRIASGGDDNEWLAWGRLDVARAYHQKAQLLATRGLIREALSASDRAVGIYQALET